ncbi:hypothetical protein Ddye_025799 [Dipteronia dyeriana]|uniref:Reverse transcriptase domain-containing protein n=1 Tax=Dipteronia dyeriana TaxID=168575 RepID=A0AAD9TKX3_9ROSI|nr:hypothetical protein Ddye_025799 [Dipteronia dyeriana]
MDVKVRTDMNRILLRDFSAEDIMCAFKQMDPLKALGLDGLLTLFYQKFRNIVGSRVVKTILDVFINNMSMGNLVEIVEVLISKVKTPSRISSLGLLVYATVRNRRDGNMGKVALKLDMCKAYDRVEWGFLKGMILKLGFDLKWRELVMKCLYSTTYSFLVNGDTRVVPIRGFRQGCHLSPYLFCSVQKGDVANANFVFN